jgi:hypothetical protein
MRPLIIFSKGIKFQYWGELYAGCKAGWISPYDVLDFCENGKIKPANEEYYVMLYLSLDDSLFAFYEQMKNLIDKETLPLIIHSEDSLQESLWEIPSLYFKIWELEFLLKIMETPHANEQKIGSIFSLFNQMNYPEAWRPFLDYVPQPNGQLLGYDELYQNFLHYIQQEIVERT